MSLLLICLLEVAMATGTLWSVKCSTNLLTPGLSLTEARSGLISLSISSRNSRGERARPHSSTISLAASLACFPAVLACREAEKR